MGPEFSGLDHPISPGLNLKQTLKLDEWLQPTLTSPSVHFLAFPRRKKNPLLFASLHDLNCEIKDLEMKGVIGLMVLPHL